MTLRYPLNSLQDNLVIHCACTILNGGVISVPTDTVYGFVCSPYNQTAIQRIMDIKRRPDEKPFALFVSSWERLCREAVMPSQSARILTQKFWPGALTIVAGAGEQCPAAREGAVGARCPDMLFLQRLLEECGGLLINTSLNRSGEPAVTSLEGLDEILEETDIVIDGGVLPPSLPSTVVNCISDPLQILREGAISAEEIRKAVSSIVPLL